MTDFDRITETPGVMGGRPCIKGTRLTASLVAGCVWSGMPVQEIIEAYPHLTPEDIEQAVAYCRRFPPDFENEVDIAQASTLEPSEAQPGALDE